MMFNKNRVQDFMDKMNEYRMKKADTFLHYVKESFLNDEFTTANIYSRDKNKYPYKVVSLKSGRYALIDDENNILFKHDDMHYCKVEFIMKTSVMDPEYMSIFGQAFK